MILHASGVKVRLDHVELNYLLKRIGSLLYFPLWKIFMQFRSRLNAISSIYEYVYIYVTRYFTFALCAKS